MKSKSDKKGPYKCMGIIRDASKTSHKMVKDSLDAEFGKSDDWEYSPLQITYESITTY